MSKKTKLDFSALQNRVVKNSSIDKFKRADEVLGTKEEPIREHVIRKSYAITHLDLNRLQSIKERCLAEKAVLQESHIIRIGIMLADKLSAHDLVKASNKILKIPMGRPRKK